MEAKFTKGEWRQSHREKSDGMYSTEVYDEEGKTICTLAWHKVPIEGGFTTDREANAKLIAAAPDLYNACVAMTGYCNKNNIEMLCPEYEMMCKALKKATE